MKTYETAKNLRVRIVFESDAWMPRRQNWIVVADGVEDALAKFFLKEYENDWGTHQKPHIIHTELVTPDVSFGYEIVVDEEKLSRCVRESSNEYGEDFDESEIELLDVKRALKEWKIKGTGFPLEKDAREVGERMVGELAQELGYLKPFHHDLASDVFWECVKVKTYELDGGKPAEGTEFVGAA